MFGFALPHCSFALDDAAFEFRRTLYWAAAWSAVLPAFDRQFSANVTKSCVNSAYRQIA